MDLDDVASLTALFSGRPIFRNRAISLPGAPTAPSLLVIRCDLAGAQPPIWRRLEVRGDLSLDEVHDVLQAAMGWTNSHLHRFFEPGRDHRANYFLTEFDVEEGDEGTAETDAQLDQVLRVAGDHIVYEYDFGDGWEHRIVLEEILPLPEETLDARCTDGRGQCPPEDVGGIHTWNALAERLRKDPDPAHLRDDDELDAYADWLPPGTSPDQFDVDEANEAIEMIDADLTTLLSKVEGMDSLPPAQPALQDVFDLAASADQVALAMLCTRAWRLATPVDASQLTAVLEPWRVLLQLARGDGIPLTPAGWMTPETCHRLWTDGGLHRSGIGKGNREQHTPELRDLRQDAVEMKLLRKNKGRLLLTPLGRKAVDDADLLLRTIACQFLKRPGSGDAIEVALALLLVAAADDRSVATHRDVWEFSLAVGADVAQWMGRLGWRRADGAPLGGMDMRVTRRAVERLGLERWIQDRELATARAMARLVLWGRA